MANLNKVLLMGNVGKDPEAKFTQTGKKVASFSLAVNNSWKTPSGEKKTETEWFNLEAWGGVADVIQQYVKKGSKLYVEGRLKTDRFEDKGETKYYTKVVVSSVQFLGDNNNGNPRQKETEVAQDVTVADDDEDIPF